MSDGVGAVGTVVVPDLDADAEWFADADGWDSYEDDDPCPVPAPTGSQVLGDLDQQRALVQFMGCQQLRSVVAWAGLNPGVADPSPVQVLEGRERAVRYGGEGTPLVAEFAAAELAVATRSTAWAAARLIADALDARYRLPRIWARVCDGEVEAWQVRKIAQHTRHLSPAAAARVDVDVVGLLGTLSWSRCEPIVVGRVIAADPEAAATTAQQARTARYVVTGRPNQHGLTGVHAQLDAAEATWLTATVDLVADLLHRRRGDTSSKDVRRATALGLLARPAEALALLLEPDNPDHHDPAPPSDTPVSDTPVPVPFGPPTEPPDLEPPVPDPHADQEPSTPRLPRHHPHLTPPTPPPDAPSDEPDEPVDGWDGWERHHPVGSLAQPCNARVLARIADQLDDPKLQHRIRPAVVLHVHVAAETITTTGAAGTGVVRAGSLGAHALATVKGWLGQATVNVQPVIDLPAGELPVDSYEIPARIRRDLAERCPGSLFPWSASLTGLDLDHTVPYRHPNDGSPARPGQTRIGNLAPHSRYEHRVLTHGQWQRRQPGPGIVAFRTPHGRVLLTSATHGTHDLGTGTLADAVWSAVR